MKRFILCAVVLLIVVIRPKGQEISTINNKPTPVFQPNTDAGLKNFDGNIADNKTVLQWTISSNEAMDMFEVERSLDGKEFKTVGIVFTAENNGIAKYAFKEPVTNISKAFYRIKLIEKSKKASYSAVLLLNKETIAH
jgi:hypothetical protein